MDAGGGNVCAKLICLGDAGGTPGIEPKGVVADVDEVFCGHDVCLCLVDAARRVAVEDGAEGSLVGCCLDLAGLPAGGGAEEGAKPVLVVEAFAIVVPDGLKDAGATEALTCCDEAGDVVQGGLL